MSAPEDTSPWVGCERFDGLMVTHRSSETCEICGPAPARLSVAREDMERIIALSERAGRFGDNWTGQPLTETLRCRAEARRLAGLEARPSRAEE